MYKTALEFMSIGLMKGDNPLEETISRQELVVLIKYSVQAEHASKIIESLNNESNLSDREEIVLADAKLVIEAFEWQYGKDS